jgi:SAM-dependent methyltransferase
VPAEGTWPFDDEAFDTVVSLETIEHSVDPAGFVAESARVLAPTGRLIISTPLLATTSAAPPSNPYHVREYTWEELGTLLSSRFNILERWTQVSVAGAAWHAATTSSAGGVLQAVKRLVPHWLRAYLRQSLITVAGGAQGAIRAGYHAAGSVQIVVAERRPSTDANDPKDRARK